MARLTVKASLLRPGDRVRGRIVAALSPVPADRFFRRPLRVKVLWNTGPSSQWNASTLIAVDRPSPDTVTASVPAAYSHGASISITAVEVAVAEGDFEGLRVRPHPRGLEILLPAGATIERLGTDQFLVVRRG